MTLQLAHCVLEENASANKEVADSFWTDQSFLWILLYGRKDSTKKKFSMLMKLVSSGKKMHRTFTACEIKSFPG